MSMWLYQMTEKNWPLGEFRCEIWENKRAHWQHRKIEPKETPPEPGDSMIFFYAFTDCGAPRNSRMAEFVREALNDLKVTGAIDALRSAVGKPK